LDWDLTLNVRWEGARLFEYQPLTPAQAARLLREVSERAAQYRKELQTFSDFIQSAAEQPSESVRLDPNYKITPPPPAERPGKRKLATRYGLQPDQIQTLTAGEKDE
jgi:hypothetical protein